MNSIVEGLRQSPKGRLQYSREIDGSPLKELLRKCSPVPMLSTTHFEKVTGHEKSLSPAAGLAPAEGEEGEEVQRGCKDSAYVEKGLKDSAEVELRGEWKCQTASRCSHISTRAVSGCPECDLKSKKESWSSLHEGDNMSSGGDCIKLSESNSLIDNRSKEMMDGNFIKFAKSLHDIHDLEKTWDNKKQSLMDRKQEEFSDHHRSLNSKHRNLLKVVKQRHLQDLQQQRNIIERLSRVPDIHHALQKVKESHDECSRRQDAKQKEVEVLGQKLMEEKVKRQLLLDQRLEELHATAQTISGLKSMVIALLDGCLHKDYLNPTSDKAKGLVTKWSEQADLLVATADKYADLDELCTKLKNMQDMCQTALDMVNGLVVEAARRAKLAADETERQRQQQQSQPAVAQQQQQQQQQANGAETVLATSQQQNTLSQSAAPSEETALITVAKEYEKNFKLLAAMESELQSFMADQQTKKVRFDLQRAVNTPINAISAVSSAHLHDKIVRLRTLLKGEVVEVTGKQVMAASVPKGITFCKNLTAKMIAKKADEQVSSNHPSAFSIAAVAVGLWVEYPDFGDLLMAHLQALCPYVIPFYPPRLPNQSTADYHKTLGYKVSEDGTIEAQEMFLRRMSGLMRMYAAILVTSPPQGPQTPHPQGLQHAWEWLGKVMNLPPTPDITAAAIYDVLQVTGHFLLKAYRVQFAKLLHCLYRSFLPKLKDVAAASGPVSRLETFLEKTMRNNAQIPEPEGFLPPRFWNF